MKGNSDLGTDMAVVLSVGMPLAPRIGILAFVFSLLLGGFVGLLAGQVWVKRSLGILLPKELLGITLAVVVAYIVTPQIVGLMPQMH